MVLQIASLNLTGATVGQTGNVSWARTDRPATLAQIQRGQHPWLELVNMSACFIAVVVGVGSDSIPLPPGSWHVYPLSRDDTSYSFTVLTNNQNATNNTVFGWYYSADEPSPSTGQIVNQSQALAAPAQGLNQISTVLAGAGSSIVQNLGFSATASSFTVASLALSFRQTAGTLPGIGRGLTVLIEDVVGGIPTPIWRESWQEGLPGGFWPMNVSRPNALPGNEQLRCSVILQGTGGGTFLLDTSLAVIGYIS